MGTPNTDLKEYATANQENCTPAEPKTEQTETKEPADKEA